METPIEIRYGVKALIASRERVLLVQESHGDGERFWTLPGGGIRSDESPRAALKRELREELDCRIDVGPVAGICPYRHRSTPGLATIYLIFEADPRSPPSPNHSEGIHDWTLASRHSLPDTLPTAFRSRLEGSGLDSDRTVRSPVREHSLRRVTPNEP